MVAVPRYSSASTSGSLFPGGNRKQSSADRSSRDQRRITIMLIIVVVVFLICQLPQAIQHIYNIYHVVVGVKRTAYQRQVCLCEGVPELDMGHLIDPTRPIAIIQLGYRPLCIIHLSVQFGPELTSSWQHYVSSRRSHDNLSIWLNLYIRTNPSDPYALHH